MKYESAMHGWCHCCKDDKHCDIYYQSRKQHVLAIFRLIGPLAHRTLVPWISTRRVEIRWVSAMTIVGTLRPVLAFAMIASESDKCLGCFRLVWQHGHVPLHHKYEPRRRTKLEKFFSKTRKYFILHVSAIVWIRMRIWPGCLQSTQCLFRNDWKVFENFKEKFKYLFSTEHKEETKLNQKNSTSPHAEIVFVKHNEILPCSLVSTRCDLKWNAREIWNFRRPWPLVWRGRRPFVLWRHNENVFRDHGWRRSDGVFVVGLLQVFIANISKLLKF